MRGPRPREPDPCKRTLDGPRIVSDHEKREADEARSEIRISGDDGNVFSGPLQQGSQGAGSLRSSPRPAMRPAACCDERDEDGRGNGAP